VKISRLPILRWYQSLLHEPLGHLLSGFWSGHSQFISAHQAQSCWARGCVLRSLTSVVRWLEYMFIKMRQSSPYNLQGGYVGFSYTQLPILRSRSNLIFLFLASLLLIFFLKGTGMLWICLFVCKSTSSCVVILRMVSY
jgi:hypothetical protein